MAFIFISFFCGKKKSQMFSPFTLGFQLEYKMAVKNSRQTET